MVSIEERYICHLPDKLYRVLQALHRGTRGQFSHLLSQYLALK